MRQRYELLLESIAASQLAQLYAFGDRGLHAKYKAEAELAYLKATAADRDTAAEQAQLLDEAEEGAPS